MNKIIIGLVLGAILCTLLSTFPVHAQQPTKIPRIGFLVGTKPSAVSARTAAFRHGLRDLGYVEGKNIVVEYRFAEGNLDRLSQLLAELVKLNVDIIVSGGPTVTRPAKAATSTIPIVMGFDDDPIGSGFVANLARPGGNITGLSTLAPEISGKQLEISRRSSQNSRVWPSSEVRRAQAPHYRSKRWNSPGPR